jgi:hypothetical protein
MDDHEFCGQTKKYNFPLKDDIEGLGCWGGVGVVDTPMSTLRLGFSGFIDTY